ncbi:hypothetical protein E1301_Tti010410 [Triplophysa tibetana]|uniref:Retrotransposon gag domain-containing protein n=1 Tax=Triplophysa tibetana TaxID=1572043 RepID=A0A5A9Q065_9TELE|nr:hypothetical protein E1301_Tti010410 [Triplophysa tibetana]
MYKCLQDPDWDVTFPETQLLQLCQDGWSLNRYAVDFFKACFLVGWDDSELNPLFLSGLDDELLALIILPNVNEYSLEGFINIPLQSSATPRSSARRCRRKRCACLGPPEPMSRHFPESALIRGRELVPELLSLDPAPELVPLELYLESVPLDPVPECVRLDHFPDCVPLDHLPDCVHLDHLPDCVPLDHLPDCVPLDPVPECVPLDTVPDWVLLDTTVQPSSPTTLRTPAQNSHPHSLFLLRLVCLRCHCFLSAPMLTLLGPSVLLSCHGAACHQRHRDWRDPHHCLCAPNSTSYHRPCDVPSAKCSVVPIVIRSSSGSAGLLPPSGSAWVGHRSVFASGFCSFPSALLAFSLPLATPWSSVAPVSLQTPRSTSPPRSCATLVPLRPTGSSMSPLVHLLRKGAPGERGEYCNI